MTDALPMDGVVSDLFDPEPSNWGLRGDAFVWRALGRMLARRIMPTSEDELVGILHSSFRWLTGFDVDDTTTDQIYREEFERGGMSSGHIHLVTWRELLMPLLVERYRHGYGADFGTDASPGTDTAPSN